MSEAPTSPPGPTAMALLGLLSVQAWTTYELAQQVQRSLNWFWPRAQRKIYDEPKRLVAAGLATASEEYTGRRKRTVYRITRSGRLALRRWLAEPSPASGWESEAMVKVFFADAGSLDALRGTLAGMQATATERADELAEYAAAPARFAQRRHLRALTLRLALEQEQTTARWAAWALEQTAEWSSTRDPAGWDVDVALDDVVLPGGRRDPG